MVEFEDVFQRESMGQVFTVTGSRLESDVCSFHFIQTFSHVQILRLIHIEGADCDMDVLPSK